MIVTQASETKFVCELTFRGKSVYSQLCFGDIRSAKQKCGRAREYFLKVFSKMPKETKDDKE